MVKFADKNAIQVELLTERGFASDQQALALDVEWWL